MKRFVVMLAIEVFLVACASSSTTPAVDRDGAAAPADDGGASEDAEAGADVRVERSLCRPLSEVAPYVGEVYFARFTASPTTGGAWLFVFAYPPSLAPTPGAGFAAIVLDRDATLVERPLDLSSLVGKLRGAPLVRPYIAVQCQGAPPCAPGEAQTSFVAEQGTAIVHEHAPRDGGRFSIELWTPVLRHDIAKTGVTFSENPTDCFEAARLHLMGPVQDVTSRCASVDRSTEPYAFLACELGRRGPGP